MSPDQAGHTSMAGVRAWAAEELNRKFTEFLNARLVAARPSGKANGPKQVAQEAAALESSVVDVTVRENSRNASTGNSRRSKGTRGARGRWSSEMSVDPRGDGEKYSAWQLLRPLARAFGVTTRGEGETSIILTQTARLTFLAFTSTGGRWAGDVGHSASRRRRVCEGCGFYVAGRALPTTNPDG